MFPKRTETAVAQWLTKSLRNAPHGIMKRKCAAALGKHISTIDKIRKHERAVSVNEIITLARVLGCDVLPFELPMLPECHPCRDYVELAAALGIEHKDVVQAPLVGVVHAGELTPIDITLVHYAMPRDDGHDSYYTAWHVDGDSMVAERIFPGDKVVVLSNDSVCRNPPSKSLVLLEQERPGGNVYALRTVVTFQNRVEYQSRSGDPFKDAVTILTVRNNVPNLNGLRVVGIVRRVVRDI